MKETPGLRRFACGLIGVGFLLIAAIELYTGRIVDHRMPLSAQEEPFGFYMMVTLQILIGLAAILIPIFFHYDGTRRY